MKLRLLFLALACAGAIPTRAAVRSTAVAYEQGGVALEGWLSVDEASPGKKPGVLVVHDWMGLGTRFARDRAEDLARLGYVAFAADIYGKGIRPANPKEAGEQAMKYKSDRTLLRARARAGLDVLAGQELVDPRRLAAIGYCFGGMAVLELARSGAPVAGVVSFHGSLDTPQPADARNIKGKVLVLHGADDPHVPAKDVAAFQDEMRAAGADWQFISYGGAVHAFSNPDAGSDNSKGAAYHEKASRRSWEAMKAFFGEIFTPRL